jgi:hypothetical protein
LLVETQHLPVVVLPANRGKRKNNGNRDERGRVLLKLAKGKRLFLLESWVRQEI